jgi:acetyl-CoA acetyltransferase
VANRLHDGSIAIVGAAETDEVGRLPGYSPLALAYEAARNALDDAGLTWSDVDGFATTLHQPYEAAYYLGIEPRWTDGTMIGGCSYLAHVRHAAAAIAAGAATTVLIVHGESGRSRVGGTPYALDLGSPAGQFELTQGLFSPGLVLGLPVLRFLHERGMTRRDLAEVVVAQREWAAMNPRALKQAATTVDEVLGSKPIAYPFTTDMCCVVTDGGAALVLTSAERAKDLRRASTPAVLAGSGERVSSMMAGQMATATEMQAVTESGREAFATSGLSHGDIDHLMIYDAFASIPLYGLENLGFVGPGESGAYIADGHTRPGGKLPLNTNGGGLNYTHTGMYGMFAIVEAVRQLRGEAAAQVPGVRTSFIQGIGMMYAAAASLVLTNQ